MSDVISGGLFTTLAHFTWPWAPTIRWYYFAEVLLLKTKLQSESLILLMIF